MSPLQSILDAHGAVVRPLFGLSEDRLPQQQEGLAEATPAGSDFEVPDLATSYHVEAPAEQLASLAEQLQASDLVESAYIKPAGSAPKLDTEEMQFNTMQPDLRDAPPATPTWVDRQGYLDAAPGGVDAKLAWTIPGGGGAGVRVIDCEWGWRFTHEDLQGNQGGVVASTDTNHGTAVLGVISGDRNGIGITGIAPDAVISASSFNDQSSSAAIKAAADKLVAGDVLLLEIHRPGPNTPNLQRGQLGFIAIEWWPDDFAAIRYAAAKGNRRGGGGRQRVTEFR